MLATRSRETREDFIPVARQAVYGLGGPAASALREAGTLMRSDAAREREARDEARLKRAWSSEKNGSTRSSFLNALMFAADPVGAVAATAGGRDPAEGLENKIASAALSEEGVWASAALAWPSIAIARPRGSPVGERMVSDGARALRAATTGDAAGVLLRGHIPAAGGESLAPGAPASARLAAVVACSVLGVGLVVCDDDGSPVPVVVVPGTQRVVWTTADAVRGPEVLSPGEALGRVREWAAAAGPSWTPARIRRALAASGLAGPYPRTKAAMLVDLSAALAGPRFSIALASPIC